MAINSALQSLDSEYSIISLFCDLLEIHTKTFKTSTIQNAFTEAGIWPISAKQALKKMKTYAKPQV